MLPVALLLALGSLWGLSPAFTKFLSLEGIPPIGVVFWQTLIAGTGLLVMCRIRGVAIGLSRRHLFYYGVMGAAGIALPNSNMVFVLGHIPAGLMSVIIVTAPVITYVVAVVIRLEIIDARRAGGVALGCGRRLEPGRRCPTTPVKLVVAGGPLTGAGGSGAERALRLALARLPPRASEFLRAGGVAAVAFGMPGV